MNKLKNTKKIYDQIEVPDNLSEIIQQTVNETSPPRSTRHFFKLLVPLTLAMTTVFVILLNTSPVLASNLSDIPLLTQIVKVLTFRNYQTMDEMKNIYVRIGCIVLIFINAVFLVIFVIVSYHGNLTSRKFCNIQIPLETESPHVDDMDVVRLWRASSTFFAELFHQHVLCRAFNQYSPFCQCKFYDARWWSFHKILSSVTA